MNEFAFHGAHCRAVVLAFGNFLLEELFEIRIVLPRNEGSVVEERTKCAIAALGEKSFAVDGGAAVVDAAIETAVGNEFLRMIEAGDVADVPDECGGADGADAGDGLEELLDFRFGVFEPLLHRLEILAQGSAEHGEGALQSLLGGLLVRLLDAGKIFAAGFQFGECRVLTEERFEFEDCRRVGETVTMTRHEDSANGSRILHVGLHGTERCLDRFGGDEGVDDGDVPAVIREEDAEEEMIDAGGFEADPGMLLLKLPVV